MKKSTIDTIITAIVNTASMSLARIEVQTVSHVAIEYSQYELTDESARDIEQVNMYFRDFANARNKRIHFKASECCFNAVYADARKFDACADAIRKTNYFKLKCDNTDINSVCAIVYALTYAHCAYLDSKNIVKRVSADAVQIDSAQATA